MNILFDSNSDGGMDALPDFNDYSGFDHADIDHDRGDQDGGDPMDVEDIEEFSATPPTPVLEVGGGMVESDDEVSPNSRRKKKRGKYRLKGKKLALTYPKCDTEPSVVLANIVAMPGGVKWAVVSREKHEDGTWHLHACVWLNNTLDTQNCHRLDSLADSHGNYQICRDVLKWLRYIIKGNLICCTPGFDPASYLQARAKKVSTSFATVATSMVAGSSIADVTALTPGFVLQHLSKMRTFAAFLDASTSVPRIEFPSVLPRGLNLSEALVYSWLRTNLIGFPVRPPFRSKQLMIIGGTGIGKSSLVLALTKFARPYFVPMEENFFDSYDDKLFDFCVFEEFRSQKTIGFMNQFVDGSPISLKVKGGQVMKRKNIPVIILSNWEPSVSYCKIQASNPEVLLAFERRFDVVRFSADHTLYTLCDYLADRGEYIMI